MFHRRLITVLVLLMISPAFAAAPQVSLDVKAFVPGPAPGTTGNFIEIISFVSNGNNVAFLAFLTGVEPGIFGPDGQGGVTVIAQIGTPAPGTGEDFENFFFFRRLSALGHIAFEGNVASGGGIWGPTATGALGLIALEQELAPDDVGIITSMTLGGIDDIDHVAFVATLEIGTNGVTADNNQGLWAHGTPGSPVLVARRGDPAPGTDGVFSSFTIIDYIGQERLFIVGFLTPGIGSVTVDNNKGLWISDGTGSLTLIAREGSPAPGTDGVFADFVTTTADDSGRGLIEAKLLVGVGSVTTGNDVGLWVTDTIGALQLVIREGDGLPGSSGVLTSFGLRRKINGNSLAFEATVLDPEFFSGIWRSVSGGPLELVVHEGDEQSEVPPIPSVISFFRLIDVMENGNVVFLADLNFFVGGALFLADTDGNLVPITYEGDNVEVAPGDLRPVIEIPNVFYATTATTASNFNDSGQFGFIYYWVARAEVVAVATITSGLGPAPAPDGRNGTSPLLADRLDALGNDVMVTWDVSSCVANDYNLIFGDLLNVGTYGLSGSQCALGSSGSFPWNGLPAGDLYFLVVGADGTQCESSWGTDSVGAERNGLDPSFECATTCKDVTGSCP